MLSIFTSNTILFLEMQDIFITKQTIGNELKCNTHQVIFKINFCFNLFF